MASLAVSNDHVAVTRNLTIDVYNYKEHVIINIHKMIKTLENDCISDIAFSPDGKFAAVTTSQSKTLVIFDVPFQNNQTSYVLARSSSKIRFTPDSKCILVADKSGDVLLYDIKIEDSGIKILGHLSLLLDVLQTYDEKYIITSDRDEKIKVSCYPNTYSIQSFCLGHKEFVNHIELLPHNEKYLTSCSGDGAIKCWNYSKGKLVYTINTSQDISNVKLIEEFSKTMDEEGVEIETLPIVHYCITALNNSTSLIIVSLHTYNNLLMYTLHCNGENFHHKLEQNIELQFTPTSMQFNNMSLYLFDDTKNKVNVIKVLSDNNIISISNEQPLIMFDNLIEAGNSKESVCKHIKTMYKRKYDNVQEYLKRKMQRLNK